MDLRLSNLWERWLVEGRLFLCVQNLTSVRSYAPLSPTHPPLRWNRLLGITWSPNCSQGPVGKETREMKHIPTSVTSKICQFEQDKKTDGQGYWHVGGKRMNPKDLHVLIPENWECVQFYSKAEIMVADGIRLLQSADLKIKRLS